MNAASWDLHWNKQDAQQSSKQIIQILINAMSSVNEVLQNVKGEVESTSG